MDFLDLTYRTPEENLACDEALLNLAEEGAAGETLRLWESPELFVVLGSSNHAEREADLPACKRENVPVLRRRSGGGTVLQGPGCLNYSLILKMEGDYRTITGSNRSVLGRHRDALQPLTTRKILLRGFSDLTLGTMKFSGNAQRRRLRFFLFHGTILYRFDIGRIGRYLRFPGKEPDYREGRSHERFVTNFPVDAGVLRTTIGNTWEARHDASPPDESTIASLVAERYGSSEWNFRL